jgi:hypothetical protein
MIIFLYRAGHSMMSRELGSSQNPFVWELLRADLLTDHCSQRQIPYSILPINYWKKNGNAWVYTLLSSKYLREGSMHRHRPC